MTTQLPHHLSDRAVPWYVAGLAFECAQCGRCCAGPKQGFVWLNQGNVRSIAAHLNLPLQDVMERYVRRVDGQLSLREEPVNRDCVFLSGSADGCRGCRVYDVRPAQCRTWPFWDANLTDPASWAVAGFRCQGINRGAMFTFEQIERRRKATHARSR